MSASNTLCNYLDQMRVEYQLIHHKPTRNLIDTAYTAQIPLASLAKAVLLEDDDGTCVLAAMPSSHSLAIEQVSRQYKRSYHRASQERLRKVFDDCAPDAIPAAGQAFSVETLCDDELFEAPFVCIESGDHEALIKLPQDQFRRLMMNVRHGHISRRHH